LNAGPDTAVLHFGHSQPCTYHSHFLLSSPLSIIPSWSSNSVGIVVIFWWCHLQNRYHVTSVGKSQRVGYRNRFLSLCPELTSSYFVDTMLTCERTSQSTNFPSRLRNKIRSQTQIVAREQIGDGPVTEMECPKCSNKQVTWSEAHLQSANDGSTIFYCCMRCHYRYVFTSLIPCFLLTISDLVSRWKEDN